MVKFLLQRPIAVLMAFTACFIIGLTTYFALPVSLLPDIAIPEITVQVSGKNSSARELENTVVKPIRQQLMQVGKLRDIHSETRDGAGVIRLNFDFGTNIDLAFIEVNEKIDAAMSYLPRDVERPRVIKASATDIPVFCLNLTLKSGEAYADANQEAFLELCEFAETVIKRRIEQLPEVAMVDITGLLKRQVQIVPDEIRLEMAGITLSDLESALAANNIEPGSMSVRDGYYEYNIKFSTLLRTQEDVENIYIRKSDRLFQLKDLATIRIVPEKETGASVSGGKRAVTLAIIKQADENMDNMKETLAEVTNHFSSIYPDIEFNISRNQTELLDYTISNLQENLTLGFLFICITAILFLGDVKSPGVIGLSMFTSIVTSLAFFYIFNMSLNIISLSGLILALGMMVDSSIVVTENITQYRARGYTLEDACAKGTTEVIAPMLSSTLTTIAVFAPLVFMSGIAGAIFYDQAFAVTVGLFVSYTTGIMLLPVLYKLIYSIPEMKRTPFNIKFRNVFKDEALFRFYDGGIDFVFKYKKSSLLLLLLTVPVCIAIFYIIPKTRMPEIDQNELLFRLEWNENIHTDESRERVNSLFKEVEGLVEEQTAYVGQQQFLLNRDKELSTSEVELYFKTSSPKELPAVQQAVISWAETNYPKAVYTYAPPETVYEKLFVTGEADIVAEFYSRNKAEAPEAGSLQQMIAELKDGTGCTPTGIAFEKQLNISIDRQKLLLYNVDYNEIYRLLKTAFKENEIATLRSYQQYLPITLSGKGETVDEVLKNTLVRTQPDNEGNTNLIPLQMLVRITPGEDLKTITAGKNGEYIPFSFYDVRNGDRLVEDIDRTIKAEINVPQTFWDIDYSGSFFSNKKMIAELIAILLISVLLMYFILSAEFESFVQPLIVLLEIPIAITSALFILWLCGHSLNLMSAIGIVVTCGIIINDSILKIDVINSLRKEGMPVMEAIHEGGRRRLRPILMTALTSIFGMAPLVFSYDMGSELQKPLAIAMISAMIIGTLISLFIIPLVYWYIYRGQDGKIQTEK
ncbi:efflux RND transporter permease subunit [Massilibacteroides sp.]|uniref:efflux RND transporter permease subunit n=1 Tax=Massilibacteroides sp. TaxID=2034766 RepID=UPI0026348659|nr:efflux RND transporter permease subunit [Massilibacteroides sp.]MDD4515263.1 efflux RND transporter permease subunit [Massilibacteroides sp.]